MKFFTPTGVIVFILLSFNGFAQVGGCTDSLALNFNPLATFNNGSCNYGPASVAPIASFNLDSILIETSGLIFWNNTVWTHNDDTDKNLYALDTLNGTVLYSVLLNSVVNNDWEEISHDSNYVYIGDFGNNGNGNRTNLKILRISKSSILFGQPDIDTIAFSYSDQIDFTPTGPNNTDFDCEAMIVTNDSIYLFTKQYVSLGTGVYSLSKNPGTHIANFRYSYNVQGLITGATSLPGSDLIVLCGYNTMIQPFLYCLYDFDSSGFFSGNKRKVEIALPFHKVEGITTNNGIKYFISNEDIYLPPVALNPQKMHILDLTSFLGSYLDTTTSINDPLSINETPVIYPNPARELIQVFIPGDKFIGDYSLFDESGKVVKRGVFSKGTNTIYTSGLKGNVYFLRIGESFNKKISLVK